MLHVIAKRELIHAQLALFIAVGLQVLVWRLSSDLSVGPQFLIALTEVILIGLIGFTINMHAAHRMGIHHLLAVALLGLITAANITSLILVLQALIVSHVFLNGAELLSSAIAIFMTNIIVFALWYWEIDSPGLSRSKWSKDEKDFQFTQDDLKKGYPDWQPEFIDYLYVSLTNAINFAPSDTKPLTHMAKLLMGAQALVSIFTLALVIARAVTVIGT
jgi:uncharacterized membrane protein